MKIVSAKIISISKHPNASKLKICEVDTGTEKVSVICGASNAREGMITILAPVGSQTPKGLEINISDLRGVLSHGMLCSPSDLGIYSEKGIIDLPPDTPLGKVFSEISPKELSSTPWFQYKLVEQHYENSSHKIAIKLEDFDPKLDGLVSETYWHNGQYHYRHFL